MHPGETHTPDNATQPTRHRFADLGPAWISAIAAAVAAVVAVASFFAGRVTAPTPAAGPDSTPASTAAASLRSAAAVGPSPGTLLAHYSVDVAAGYGIDVAGQAQRPREGIPGDASLVLPIVGQISSSDGGKLAQLDPATTPGYDVCVANTRFTTTAYVGRGDAFCYTGRGFLAAIKVVNQVIAVTGDYDTLDITVWKAPAT